MQQRKTTTPTAAEVAGQRVEDIANLIALGQWKDRITVVGLAGRWGIPEEEVQRLHRVAATKCRLNRGTLGAQAEVSVGVVRELRDSSFAEAKGHEASMRSAMRGDQANGVKPDHAAAETYGKLAALARKSALQAQQHLDSITIGRNGQKLVKVNVSVTTDASFAAAWGIVRAVLDARYPGAGEVVETALAAWEDRGDEGVTDLLSELADDVAVSANIH